MRKMTTPGTKGGKRRRITRGGMKLMATTIQQHTYNGLGFRG